MLISKFEFQSSSTFVFDSSKTYGFDEFDLVVF